MRRKKTRQKEISEMRKNGATEEEITEFEQSMIGGVGGEEELLQQIEDVNSHYKDVKTGVCGGFRKRCIYEMKATQEKGKELDEKEQLDAHIEAADALKKRFLRDHKALQEGLEMERQKQRKNVIERRRLNFIKKSGKGKGMMKGIGSTETDDAEMLLLEKEYEKEYERDTKIELEILNSSFEERQADALADPQGAILLSLSGIFADENTLKSSSSSNSNCTLLLVLLILLMLNGLCMPWL